MNRPTPRNGFAFAALIAGLWLCAAAPVHAATWSYDQALAIPGANQISDTDSNVQAFDDFTVGSDDVTLTSITWYGLDFTSPSAPFTIGIYGNVTGSPDKPGTTALYSFSASPTPDDGGAGGTGDMYYAYTVTPSITINLTHDTKYWLSILESDGTDQIFSWAWAESSDGGAQAYARAISTGTGGEADIRLAYSLLGETQVIPVPAALPLFLSGLVGLGIVARRRQKKAEIA